MDQPLLSPLFLVAYVPFFEQAQIHIGPLTIAAFGVIVATAVMVGLSVGSRRFRTLGLDAQLGEGLAWWVVVGGFLGAHLFSVLFYFPHEVAENPLILLKLWEDISSFGGIVGGSLAIWLFLHRRAAHLDGPTRWAFVDVAAYVFPISLMIGRLACTIAHDHPGTVTTFPLAVSLARPEARALIVRAYQDAGRAAELPSRDVLAGLGFHDLGWYEFIYLAAVVVPVVFLLARRERRRGAHHPGTFLVAFIALYMPARFALDFLRVSDVRYAGLTPAQWAACVALLSLPLVLFRIRRVSPHAFAVDSRPSATIGLYRDTDAGP
jgi:phosphatidylglycerol:prolipoprotein diacylglycerol transferase